MATERPGDPRQLEREDLLLKIPFFNRLNREALAFLSEIAKEETVPSGTCLFRQGDLATHLYLLVKGKVQVSTQTKNETQIHSYGPGMAFGEQILLEDVAQSSEARTLESTTLLTLSKADFHDLLWLHKDLAYEVLWNMVGILSQKLSTMQAVGGEFDTSVNAPNKSSVKKMK